MLVPAIHERKSWLIFLLAVLVGINFYFNFSFKLSLDERAKSIDRAFGRLLLPIQSLLSTGKILISDSATNLKDLSSAKEINLELRSQLDSQTLKLSSYDELRLENERLRALVDFRERFSRDTIAARVVGSDPSALFKTIIVNRGADDCTLGELHELVALFNNCAFFDEKFFNLRGDAYAVAENFIRFKCG